MLARLLLLVVSHAMAQEFDTHWISYPTVDSTSQIWFRHTYTTHERPVQATISIKTTGRFELFVNERNVSTDVLMPYREEMSNNVIVTEYNITRFLHSGTNTIAVWYSPSFPHINPRQISLTYNGKTKDGHYFSHISDESWLCHKANRQLLPSGGELSDNTYYPLKWNSDDIDAACWLGTVAIPNTQQEQTTVYKDFYTAYKVKHIRHHNYFDIRGDSTFYDFGTPFRGWIRVTLRNAKAGESIDIDGLKYICNGEMDEQAYRKFTLPECQRIIIWGDNHFKIKQIQDVETLEIVPYIRHAFDY